MDETLTDFFGGVVERLPHGTVEVPFWGMRALTGYFRGAETLYTAAEAAGELEGHCLPIAYLQRHWIELFLKYAIDCYHHILSAAVQLVETGKWKVKSPPPALTIAPAPREHRLGRLRDLLKDAMTQLPLKDVEYPIELDALVDRFEALENKNPDAWRYDWVGPKGQPLRENFEAGTRIDLLDIQARIREFDAKHIEPEESCFAEHLSAYSRGMTEQLRKHGLL